MCRSSALSLTVAGVLALSACATIVSGGHQPITVASSPTGAKLVVDGVEYGVTPRTVQLERKSQHVIRIEMDGFKPYEMVVQKKVNGWFWVNFVSWGIVGLAIDAVTGSMYKLTPEQVNTSLTQVAAGGPDDAVHIFVTMQPDPAWEQIGTLEPAR